MNCGHPLPGDEDVAFVAAHDCAVQAVTSELDFVVVWDQQGVDSRVASAYLGIHRGGAWELEAFTYDGAPGGTGGENAPLTWRSSCASIEDLGDCGLDLRAELCLACVGRTDTIRCPIEE